MVRDGFDDTQPQRQRYRCKACAGRFDDLTGTVLAGHHQPLRIWVLCLYLMGLNLSNRQIAQELGLDGSDAQAMTEQLRRGLVAKAPPVRLEGEVEIDEVYVVAGHKGQPAAVAKRGARDAAAGWRERRAAARWRRVRRTAPNATRPRPDPARGGQVFMRMLADRCAAEDDPAGHRGRRGQGRSHPHRRVRQLRPPAGRPGAAGT